jgi:orotidine-5'-phosphate decarboxylase
MYWLNRLRNTISNNKNFLCIGLDPDIDKLPTTRQGIKVDIESFCKEIIDSTEKHCVGYKVNTAFFEALGSDGFKILENIAEYLPSTHFRIADAKRADIGNTSRKYAEAFFKNMPFDAITLNPYMGIDSITPFDDFNN